MREGETAAVSATERGRFRQSKRVVHVTSAHAPDDVRIFRKECRSLASSGYTVTLVASGDPPGVETDGVHLVTTRRARTRSERMTRGVLRVFRRARSLDADIYHIHDPELLAVALLLRRNGAKVIYDAHEDLPRSILSKRWIARPLRAVVSYFAEVVENWVARRLDAVVGATPAIAERFAKRGIRAVAVSNFPMLEEFPSRETATVARDEAVCYVGGITHARGIREMVNGAARANVRLLLVGNFRPKSLRDELAATAEWNHVRELGQLNRDAAIDVMRRARAGIALFHAEPNHVQAQPNKLFEYMAAELPIVASNFPLWRQVILETGCGLCVDPLDTAAVADAIRSIIEDPEGARRMGMRGREAVESRFNWPAEFEHLLALYDALLIESPA